MSATFRTRAARTAAALACVLVSARAEARGHGHILDDDGLSLYA